MGGNGGDCKYLLLYACCLTLRGGAGHCGGADSRVHNGAEHRAYAFGGAGRAFRATLPGEIGISYDEWNTWSTWFREEGIVDGLYVAKMLNLMMRNWKTLGLKCVCYFQAINEQAICVNPFESHLTSVGEAMRLWKGHLGGVPVEDATGRVPPVGGSKRRKRSCRTALRSAAATRAVPARGRSTGISTNSHFPRLAKRLYVSLLRKDNGLCDDDGWNEAPGGRPLPFRRQDGGIPS